MDNKLEELRSALSHVDLEKVDNKETDYKSEDNIIDLSSLNTININSIISAPSYGTYTINTSGTSPSGGTQFAYSGGSTPIWSSSGSTPGLSVSGDSNFEGDIKWKGRSLGTLLQSIEDRLAILADPDPEKLEKFHALKKAYDHYKMLEALIGND